MVDVKSHIKYLYFALNPLTIKNLLRKGKLQRVI